jgi:CheY-like chemotaxis protein
MAQRKVLLIEADPIRKIDRTKTLRKLGYKAVTASSGSAALRILRNTLVDAAIIDADLTDMPGVHLLREMRKQGVEVPVILTGRDVSRETLILALRGRASDYLERPFTPSDLGVALTRCLLEPEVSWTPPRRLDCENLARAISENRFKWDGPHPLALGMERIPKNPENAFRALVDGLRGHRPLQDKVLAEFGGSRFPGKRKANSLREAVRTHGPRMVAFVLAEQALESFYLLDEADELHADVAWGMWECARLTAYLCLHLARKLGLWDAEGLALAGLVHNFGEVLVVRYEASLDKGQVKGREEQILQDLDERISECHESIGREALKLWGGSDWMVELAGDHHSTASEDMLPQDKVRRELALVCWQTALRWGLGYLPSHDDVDPRPGLRALNIQPKDAKVIADRSRDWLLPIDE